MKHVFAYLNNITSIE